jgi:uncharacterized protein YfaS (alpha-2-macroglobulin family)
LYNIDEIANILIQSPFKDEESEAYYEISTESINYIERFKIKEEFTISIPIKKEYVPNINLTVFIVGKKSFASGFSIIKVSKLIYGLNVIVQPKKKYSSPSTENKIIVKITDYKENKIKNCEVTCIIVDEAVLSLTGWLF